MDSCFTALCETLSPGYDMLMRPYKAETAVHGCQSTGIGQTVVLCCVTIAFRWFIGSHTVQSALQFILHLICFC